ncbi:MAG: hypothetical protein JNM74_26875, partial [Myxococcales bacterium]|nr:hypothetical protein [Myxococcales bacterium]
MIRTALSKLVVPLALVLGAVPFVGCGGEPAQAPSAQVDLDSDPVALLPSSA